MGVVTISSSASRCPLGLSTRFQTQRYPLERPLILSFKTDRTQNISLVAPHVPIPLPIEIPKKNQKRVRRTPKLTKRVKAVSTDEVSTSLSTVDVDYNEAAAKLENIYKLSPPSDVSDLEDSRSVVKRPRRKVKKNSEGDELAKNETSNNVVVRSRVKRGKRLSLVKRIELSKKTEDDKVVTRAQKKKVELMDEDEKVVKLIREYLVSTDVVNLDWKKMKIPPVLSSSEHALLFKLVQPMKGLVQVKENLRKGLGREPFDVEVAEAKNMGAMQVRKQMDAGQAARSKLIKHNLRLVLFVINKYFQEFANSPRFNDLCQAGVMGLMTAIDRFEPKRRFRLSTYGLFWIRHAIIRSMTISSFTRVSFGLESVRTEIYKAKLELMFELNRLPTDEEIIERVGISPERHREVMRASRQVFSLHSRHSVTQEEIINGITDVDGDGDDKRRQSALLRLALDDVLDSLKPKESLVIRQRYGLDGKGDRTLGEIAGNLNISREMVRKHEVKALMKLKHPARVDYLRNYIF